MSVQEGLGGPPPSWSLRLGTVADPGQTNDWGGVGTQTIVISQNPSGAPISGSIAVMADDTTSVWLNGVELVHPASTEGNTFRTCSDFAIGCFTSTAGTVNLLPALRTGSNTLTFGVEQIAGDSFGLDYTGSVTSVTPEPATLGLMGLGLAAISFAGRKLVRKR